MSNCRSTSHFSFLRGVSSAEELFAAAALLGIEALGIVDRNSSAGIVRALRAAKDDRRAADRRLPARSDGRQRRCWSIRRPRRLGAALPPAVVGKSRVEQEGEKGQCFLDWDDVVA